MLLLRVPVKNRLPASKRELRLGAWLYNPKRDELKSGDEIVALTGMEAG